MKIELRILRVSEGKGKSLYSNPRLSWHDTVTVTAAVARAKARDHFRYTFSQQNAALARMLSAHATRTSVSAAYYD
jgi:hypothetical protein